MSASPHPPTPSTILGIAVSACVDDVVSTSSMPPPAHLATKILFSQAQAPNQSHIHTAAPITCSRIDCHRVATHQVVVLLYPACPPHLNPNPHPFETFWDVFVCQKHTRSTYAYNILTDEVWFSIVNHFTNAGEPPPARELARIRFDPISETPNPNEDPDPHAP